MAPSIVEVVNNLEWVVLHRFDFVCLENLECKISHRYPVVNSLWGCGAPQCTGWAPQD